MDRLFLILVHQ